jgi:hypothetical protein
MKPQVFACITVTGVILAAAGGGNVPTTLVAGIEAKGSAEALQQKGRFKQEGENCVWDANDSGPNQCTPRTPGRFKKEKEACVWDAKDNGPDQCTPPKGRWKVEGDRCYWDPKDEGPNQCNPRQPRKPGE